MEQARHFKYTLGQLKARVTGIYAHQVISDWSIERSEVSCLFLVCLLPYVRFEVGFFQQRPHQL